MNPLDELKGKRLDYQISGDGSYYIVFNLWRKADGIGNCGKLYSVYRNGCGIGSRNTVAECRCLIENYARQTLQARVVEAQNALKKANEAIKILDEPEWLEICRSVKLS